jgi:16S rRNA processing protein RimM
MTSDRIQVGRVIGVHGVLGEVAVRTSGDTPEGLARYTTLFYVPRRGEEKRLDVESSRVHRGVALVKFLQVATRDEAEALVGGLLEIERADLKPADEGRHYVVDVIGLPVFSTEGVPIGTVRDVFETGANDVFVLDVAGREVLVPVVDHVVKEIDTVGKRIVIEVLEGLLD